eukprot:4610218-Prymnesium_polylepis.1
MVAQATRSVSPSVLRPPRQTPRLCKRCFITAASTMPDEDAELSLCIACEERVRSARMLPCSHCTMCDHCTVRLIGAGQRQCPSCRAPFERVEWSPPDPDGPVVVRRIPTYEAPSTPGLSIREFLLSAAIEPFVVSTAAAIPAPLLAEAGAALDALAHDDP